MRSRCCSRRYYNNNKFHNKCVIEDVVTPITVENDKIVVKVDAITTTTIETTETVTIKVDVVTMDIVITDVVTIEGVEIHFILFVKA